METMVRLCYMCKLMCNKIISTTFLCMCVYANNYVDCEGNLSVPVFHDNVDVQIVQVGTPVIIAI